MKRFSCLNLRSVGLLVASTDVICALCTLLFCSFYLWQDFVQTTQLQEGVHVQNPLANYAAAAIDYIMVHNFSNAFFMVVCITLWIKSLVNIVVATILIDGIRKQRLISLAPWLINTIVSMFIEIAIFIFMEIKIDEVEPSMERRIARCVVFGVFLVINALFAFGIFALYNVLKTSTSDNRALQDSIAETSGMFQHVKV